MNLKKSIEQINNTLELWDQICETADFKSNDYDKELLSDIKKRLGFDEKCDIRAELSLRKTTSEQLVFVLHESLKPFSIMLCDLLKMFEEAGAQYTDKNIQIAFNFDDAKERFNLDLDHFRVYKEIVEKGVCYELQLESINPWNDFISPLRELLHSACIRLTINQPPFPIEINQWLDEYSRNREKNWPEWFPSPPKCGIERIDNLIAEIWQVPKAACELYNKCYQADLGRWESLRKKVEGQNSGFYQAESDFWIGQFVKYVCFLVYEIKKNTETKDNPSQAYKEIGDKLEVFRNRIPIASIKFERLVNELLNILNLPVWKKRYALYSAWVSTQIITAFDKRAVKYNVVDGMLSFSFGGSIIAYIEQSSVKYTLFAELRTPFTGVKGHGRTHSIQPDYSLCVNDESDPKNTVLVVECKQYKKASKRNFTDAIIDYAGGRPIAQIMLVNYTPIPDSIRTGLSPELSDRIPFFDALIPGTESCELFKKAVKEALPKCFSVSLSWEKAPLDMDIMLIITEPNGEKTTVDFSKKGKMDQFPYAYLINDDRNGYGHEVIHTLVYGSMKYDYYIHNCSGEKTDGTIRIEVDLYKNSGIWMKHMDYLDTTSLWHILKIDHFTVCIVNKIVPAYYVHSD